MGSTYAELPRLMTLMTGDEKHGPSATSALDALWVLYDQVLRVSPATVDDPGRDRFLLPGHPAEVPGRTETNLLQRGGIRPELVNRPAGDPAA